MKNMQREHLLLYSLVSPSFSIIMAINTFSQPKLTTCSVSLATPAQNTKQFHTKITTCRPK